MELGLFMMPLHPPHRPVADTYEEDLDKIRLADRLGFKEAWVGQHVSAGTEPVASPLAFMSALIPVTEQITFATGVINLPSYHPAVVAAEVAQFDHMSRGRFIFGVGPGALATDFQLFGNEDNELRAAKALESVSMIKQIWSQDPPYVLEGEHWSFRIDRNIDAELGTGYMPKPYQQPHPPLASSIMSPFSSSAVVAGREGWIPISANFTPTYAVASHWQKYCEGCEQVGREPDPSVWRVARNIVVAATDEEARDKVFDPKASLNYYLAYLWRALELGNYTIVMKPDPKMSDDEVTMEMLLESMVIYGSPATVADKILELREQTAPFGTLVLGMQDWEYDRAGQEETMRLLAQEVMPLVNERIARGATVVA